MGKLTSEQRRLVVAYAKQGLPPVAIVQKLADCYQRVGLESVRSVIVYERKKGARIPMLEGAQAPIVMPEARAVLQDHATRRRMTVRALAREIITAVAAAGIVDAVLDDGPCR